ncbi:MAG TPA: NADPH-dependent FMN reductase [Thermoleophilaceae bacterium]|jgi:NAD(P)H-dependent FMN reductase
MPELLLLCGSLRQGSTNEAALRTVRDVLPDGWTAVTYDGMAALPHFNPDDDHDPLPAEVVQLRDRLRAADAVLISTPEYAGALPGSFKNLLDWTIGGDEIYEAPVAWVNIAGPAAPSGGADAHDSLRKVLSYAHADLVEAACARVPITRADVAPSGLVEDAGIRGRLREIVDAIDAHLTARG